MDLPHIVVILGTAREGRRSLHAAEFIYSVLKECEDMTVELVDVRDHTLERTIPSWEKDEETQDWKNTANHADAFLIVTPEYNHGYPGELKQLLDSAYDAYAHKPVALAGVSRGSFGGARVVDHIKPVLIEYKMVPIRTALYFSNAKELFDPTTGKMSDDKQPKFRERIKNLSDMLVKYAQGMREVRDNIEA